MNSDPVEGVHYIFDRYAFLNKVMEDGGFEARVSEASTKVEINKACEQGRFMYHPDRQVRAGAEMKATAAAKTVLIADCERFLLNPELKNFYDGKLAEFREKKPHLISDNGVPIISLGDTFFDIGALLSDTVVDTSGFEAQVKAMLQYDDKRLPQMKSLYDLMPDNPQAKNLYRDALTQQLTYLSLLEDSAWAKVGYMNRKEKMDGFLARPADYTQRIEAELQKSATRDIDSTIERHSAVSQIGMAKTPLQLEAVDGTSTPAPGGEIVRRELIAEFKAVAHKNFEIRADYVRDVAKQKQAVLEELCTLTPVDAVHPPVHGQTEYDFYLLNPPEDGKQQALFRMTLDITTGNAGVAESYKGETLDSLKAKGFTRGGFTVTRNPEISDFLIEIGAACERFLDLKEKEKAAAPKADSAPKPPQPKI